MLRLSKLADYGSQVMAYMARDGVVHSRPQRERSCNQIGYDYDHGEQNPQNACAGESRGLRARRERRLYADAPPQ